MHDLLPVPTLLARLATFADDVTLLVAGEKVAWRRRPSAGQWSLTELFCHLRDVEREIHQARFRALLAADNAFLPGASPDEWAESRDYQAQDGATALRDFTAARRQTAQLLQEAPPEFWRRYGRHSFFGPTSSHELLALVVEHDQAHREQIEALLVNSY